MGGREEGVLIHLTYVEEGVGADEGAEGGGGKDQSPQTTPGSQGRQRAGTETHPLRQSGTPTQNRGRKENRVQTTTDPGKEDTGDGEK